MRPPKLNLFLNHRSFNAYRPNVLGVAADWRGRPGGLNLRPSKSR
jgi:hypothetical protein